MLIGQIADSLEGQGNILWLEDPLIPEDHHGYRELTRSTPLRMAMGETECNHYGVRDRLQGQNAIIYCCRMCVGLAVSRRDLELRN